MHSLTRITASITLLTLALLNAPLCRAADKPADGFTPAQATFTAGKETKIIDPATGGLGYYVVYVPKDYSPEREWPLIICYHGSNGNPQSWPFKDLTDGQNYLILGMEYLNREKPDATTDVDNLKRILKYLNTKVRINAKLTFMGGFSQGGWSTSSFSNLMIDQLAGLIITGAGGSPGDKAALALSNKPVFIGVGEQDKFNADAKKAKDAYTDKKAIVTFEEFKGLGHAVDTKDKPFKDWLLKWGPQNQMIASLAQAKAAEKNGRLGEAFNLYTATAKMSGGDEAAALAKEIAEPAEKKLADAAEAIAGKRYPDAVKLLMSVTQIYAGSPFAEKAKQQVDQIQTDPAIKAEVELAKANARADALEAQAQAAEKAKDYARALPLYETYVAQFPKAPHFAAIKAHLDELKSNKTILASAKGQGADRECKGWLSTADNYIQNNMNDKAKPYLQKILDKYGDTEWAGEAKKRLGEMK